MARITTPSLIVLAAALFACAAQADVPVPPSADDANADADASPVGSDASPEASTDASTPSSDVTITDIPELPGSRLMVRPDAIPAPGIVVLHGSEGGTAGYIDDVARPLAESGFAVVTLCWFGCAGTPDVIHRIPLEDTIAAVSWLRASDAVGGHRVGLFGWSRGAEQSVLLGSLLASTDPIATIAVHAPSDTVVASWDPAAQDSIYEQDPSTGQWIFGPAWTWQGQPLFGETTGFGTPGPRIRVEDYPGAVYLSHGVDDDLWSVQRSHAIEDARQARGLETEAHYWDGEGHILMQPANLTAFQSSLTEFFRRELAP